MSSRKQNIVTRNDIENINEGKEEDNDIISLIIKIVLYLLLIGFVFYFIYELIVKDKYSYTDENGENHEVSVNFSEEDLQKVYEELSEIPLEI